MKFLLPREASVRLFTLGFATCKLGAAMHILACQNFALYQRYHVPYLTQYIICIHLAALKPSRITTYHASLHDVTHHQISRITRDLCLSQQAINKRPFSWVSVSKQVSKCETFPMKMSSACSFISIQIKVIFIRMVSHLDSL